MIDSILFKSLGVSVITGSLTEGLKILLLYYNFSTHNVLLYSMIFGYIIAYSSQRHIFEGGRFFGLSLLKYVAVSLVVIQFTTNFLNILEKNKTIKSFIEDKNISETRSKIYKYFLINFCILIIYICISYPLLKSFIFVKNKETDYIHSYMLYALATLIYLYSNNYFDSKIFDTTRITTNGNSMSNFNSI